MYEYLFIYLFYLFHVYWLQFAVYFVMKFCMLNNLEAGSNLSCCQPWKAAWCQSKKPRSKFSPPQKHQTCTARFSYLSVLNYYVDIYLCLSFISTMCSLRWNFSTPFWIRCRSHWSRGLRRRSAAARLLRLWVRIPPGAWMVVCCECCVLSGRGFCFGLITCPEESYRVWCVHWVWSLSPVSGVTARKHK